MEIRRKIASKYLKSQYERAQKYLEKEADNKDDIETICGRVRSAGLAYAQVEYTVFFVTMVHGENPRKPN